MKVIEVNKMCKVNQENIAPCRDRKIAINVLSEKNGDIDFNYVLAIENWQQCCEIYGTVLKKMHDGSDVVFVKKIVHDVKIASKLLKETDEYLDYNSPGIYKACKIYGKNNKLLYIAFVYNDHNGYYSHEVYTDINGNTEVDWL